MPSRARPSGPGPAVLAPRREAREHPPVAQAHKYFKFRCTGCGNCCKEPLLPMTDADLRRISERTGDAPADIVRFIDRNAIDMDDEPESFLTLRQGKRVMILRHQSGGCRYLGDDNRCTIYGARPLGCRIFPFDPLYDKQGGLRRLKLIQATDCLYEMDGENDPDAVQKLHRRYEAQNTAYQAKVAEWNRVQQARKRAGRAAQTSREFLEFLGFPPS
ncbi:MAG: YkgJ family cysteine cluster protein [Myxococcota bacterium]